MSATLINIEGNIGVGKTTFMNRLKKKFSNYSFMNENVDEWKNIYNKDNDNILSRFYTNMNRYSFTFQNFVYVQRYMTLLDEIKLGNKIIFMDRSPDTDRFIFATIQHENKFMSDIEWDIYNKWCNMFSIYLNNFKQKIIYLKCFPEIAFDRIKYRGRNEEKDISIEYLNKLHNYHDRLMNLYDSNDRIVIDYNKDLNDDNSDEFINYISTMICNKFLSS